MNMLLLIIGLFLLAVVAPFILPNKRVSRHSKDWEE